MSSDRKSLFSLPSRPKTARGIAECQWSLFRRDRQIVQPVTFITCTVNHLIPRDLHKYLQYLKCQ